MKERVVRIEGWKYYLVFFLAFIICVFAVFGLVMLTWVVLETWPKIAGTGEHSVRMTGGGR